MKEKILQVKLSDLPEVLEGPEPSKDFMASVTFYGIIYPIILSKEEGKYIVVDGRRRIKAARINGDETITALVYEDAPRTNTIAWSIILNEQRSQNIITEYRYYQEMMSIVNENRWEELRKELGLNKAHVEKILSLKNIDDLDTFFEGYESGKISASTLFAMAKLSKKRQTYLKELYDAQGKISASDIKETQRLQKMSALTNMPQLEIATEKQTEPPAYIVISSLLDETAKVFVNIQDAYNTQVETPGAKIYKLIEV